jgi:phenylpyruvate tautomerase PptA (4-oxalocrotonate tautomerase family)
MPLHRIYHPVSAFSSEDKAELSERITAIYTASGLPAFYVVVLFTPIEKESFYVGGKSTDKFVRIVAQHLARQIPTAEGKQKFSEKYENALAPFIKDRGYDWEVDIQFFFSTYYSFIF